MARESGGLSRSEFPITVRRVTPPRLKAERGRYRKMIAAISRLRAMTKPWEYSNADATVITIFTLGLRLSMGWIFIWSGFDKLITDFSARGFLINGSSGPLKDMFVNMGQSGTALDVVDPLVIYGQILIGLALILGVFTRIALLMAAIQMFLFYLVQLWPPNNPFLDDHLVYILIFALLGALGAGRILGLDAFIENRGPVRRISALKLVLG